jgi:hypothetical protein
MDGLLAQSLNALKSAQTPLAEMTRIFLAFPPRKGRMIETGPGVPESGRAVKHRDFF